MNARLYDPKIGKFFSPDNYITESENPQSYNRYSYALNNPLKYTDPSGNSYLGRTGMGSQFDEYYANVRLEIEAHNMGSCLDEVDYAMGWDDNGRFRFVMLEIGSMTSKGNAEEKGTSNTESKPVEDNRPWYEKAWGWIKGAVKWLGKALTTIVEYRNAFIDGVADFIFNPNKFAVDAILHYIYSSDTPMMVDASQLKLGSISQQDLTPTDNPNIFILDYFNIKNRKYVFSQRSIAFGKIALLKVGDNEFVIQDDFYNFEMQPGQDARNRATNTLFSFIMFITDFLPNGEERKKYLLMKNAEMDRNNPSRPGLYGFPIHFKNKHVSIPEYRITIEDAVQ